MTKNFGLQELYSMFLNLLQGTDGEKQYIASQGIIFLDYVWSNYLQFWRIFERDINQKIIRIYPYALLFQLLIIKIQFIETSGDKTSFKIIIMKKIAFLVLDVYNSFIGNLEIVLIVNLTISIFVLHSSLI